MKIASLLFVLLALVLGMTTTAASASGEREDPYSRQSTTSACPDRPSFLNVEVAPQQISASIDSEIEVHISGIVSAARDCNVCAVYIMENDSGVKSDFLDLAEDGSFDQTIIVNISKSDQDTNSRTLAGMLTVGDEANHLVQKDFTVTVVYDEVQQVSWNH